GTQDRTPRIRRPKAGTDARRCRLSWRPQNRNAPAVRLGAWCLRAGLDTGWRLSRPTGNLWGTLRLYIPGTVPGALLRVSPRRRKRHAEVFGSPLAVKGAAREMAAREGESSRFSSPILK